MRFWPAFLRNTRPLRSPRAAREASGGADGTLTKSRAGLGPAHRGHDDEAEALVLAAPDLHVVGLHGRADHAAAAAAATADAAGAPAAGAHRVQGVLAALRGALLLGQRRGLVAAVMGGGRRGHLVLGFGGCRREREGGRPDSATLLPAPPACGPRATALQGGPAPSPLSSLCPAAAARSPREGSPGDHSLLNVSIRSQVPRGCH